MTKESNVSAPLPTVTEEIINMLTILQQDMDFLNEDLENSIDRLTGTVQTEESKPNSKIIITRAGVEGQLGLIGNMLGDLYYSVRKTRDSAERLNKIA